jgi:hypothetical protein
MTGRKGPRPIPVIVRVDEVPTPPREPYKLKEHQKGRPLVPRWFLIGTPAIGLMVSLSIVSNFGWVLGQLVLAILIGCILVAVIAAVFSGNLKKSKISLREAQSKDAA